MKYLLIAGLSVLTLASCVSKKKFLESQVALRESKNDSAQLANSLNMMRTNAANLQQEVTQLEERKAKLQRDLQASNEDAAQKGSALQQSQAQIAEQQRRLAQLQSLIDQQRQASEALNNKMKQALTGFAASDLTVSQKNGKVYVSLSENLLFPSGSATINMNGKMALKKLAEVLNQNPEIRINIEGHTDSVPIKGRFEDNWELSLARSASIVRILTRDYAVDPLRIVASGHSEYDPVDTNSSADGRARNRRTEIILSPKLDELYQLIGQ